MKPNKVHIAAVLVVAAILLVPLFFQSSFTLHMFTLIFFYVALTSAWNIPVFGGKLSLGHAGFVGLGAYTVAILYVKHGISPWIGIFPAILVGLAAAALLCLPLLRLRGPFFTLATIAFAEVIRLIAIDWRSLTNGSVGMNIPFRPGWMNLTFQSGKAFYYIAFILAILTIVVSRQLNRSALGYHLRAAASDEEAAQALGVHTARSHILALMWSGGLTVVIGAFYAFFIYVIEPNSVFSLTSFSLQPALNGIIGGLGTVWGPVLGAVVMTPLGEFMRFYLGTIQQGLNFVVYGIVLIATVFFIPGGLYSIVEPRLKPFKGELPAGQPESKS